MADTPDAPETTTAFGHEVPVLRGPDRGGNGDRDPAQAEARKLENVENDFSGKSTEDVVKEIMGLLTNQNVVYANETKNRIRSESGRGPPGQLGGSERDPKSPRGKAISAKENAQRLLIAAKLGKIEGELPAHEGQPPHPVSDFAREVLRAIGNNVDPSIVSEQSGAFLYDFMRRILLPDGNPEQIRDFNDLKSNAISELTILNMADPLTYRALRGAFTDIGGLHGLSPEDSRKIFDDELSMQQQSMQEMSKLENDRMRALNNYIGENKEDADLIEAMYSPQAFLKFVETMQHDPEAERKYGKKFADLAKNPVKDEEYWREMSDALSRQITHLLAKIFRSAAKGHKGKFLDEIANANPMESMTLAKDYLLQALERLSGKFADPVVRDQLGINDLKANNELRFFSKRKRAFETERVMDYKDKDGNKKFHRVLRDRRIAVGKSEEVELYEFISGIKYQAERFIDDILPYNHNIQALFLRQAGQDGTFWGQIGNYASQNMPALNVDALHDMPDADIVFAAMRLYTKYVKEDFAHYDWRNEPGRFTDDYDTPTTPIQKDVIEDLKRLFPDLRDHNNKWRIDQAMNIAIGMSRGVYLTEPTTVAWADAPHKGDGGATFESYYTNSNAALLGLNPQHNPDRWKTPSNTLGPLLQMPVAGRSPGSIRRFTRKWHHGRLYEQLIKRENSYKQGLPAFELMHPATGHEHDRRPRTVFKEGPNWIKQKLHIGGGSGHGHGGHDDHGGHGHDNKPSRFDLFMRNVPLTEARRKIKEEKWTKLNHRRLLPFIDALPNIGKVGGLIERGGWRNKAYEGVMIYNKDGSENVIETFKALENVGFEAVKWWAENNKLMVAEMPGSHGGGNFTDDFGRYLFDKYIQKNLGIRSSYEQYKDQIIKDLRAKKKNDIRLENNTVRRDPWIQYAGVITTRAMACMLKERTPSLMVAIERTRLSETGIRAWEKLREDLDWMHQTKDASTDDRTGTERMDRAMKNIMLVEQKVRQKTSEVMKDAVNDQLKANPQATPDLRKVNYADDQTDYRVSLTRFENELRELITGKPNGQFENAKDQADYDNAVKLYKATHNHLDEAYINNFAEKIRLNGKPEKFFPFAVAAEELDTSFITYQSAGPDIMRRALGEIGHIEAHVVKNIQENFIGKLKHVALHEHKFDTLIHAMHEVHQQLDSIHGEKYANEIVDYMARMATAFFRKDSDAIGWLGKLASVGKPHSLAAEFAGGSWKNVWEWEAAEVDSFYRELDRQGLLPDRPINPMVAEEIMPKKLFGITWGYKKVLLEPEPGEPEHSGRQIRKDMGARYRDVAFELARKWLLIGLAGLAAIYVWKAIKEATDKK